MSIDNSEPAFPVSTSDGNSGHQDGESTWQFPGMSLRDYFASKAMASIIKGVLHRTSVGEIIDDPSELAHAAYSIANAMLKAREA